MGEPAANRPPPATRSSERTAGWILLGGFALVVWAIILYLNDDPSKPAVLGLGLLVTLAGLIAFAAVLNEGGETVLPRFGAAAFAIASICWIASDQIDGGSGNMTFETGVGLHGARMRDDGAVRVVDRAE